MALIYLEIMLKYVVMMSYYKGAYILTIQGVLFDLDGTLVNSTVLILRTFKVTLKHFIKRDVPDEEIIRFFGLPLRECLANFDAAQVDEMITYYRNYNNEMHDVLLQPFPHIEDGLKRLENMQIKKAVVTSKTHNMAKRGLKILKLDKYILDIIGCEECTKHKPDPEPMLKGAASIILPPGKCLCVGDSPYDLLSGRAAGCKTVAVGWSLFDKKYFFSLIKPDYVIEDLQELGDIVQSINEKGQ